MSALLAGVSLAAPARADTVFSVPTDPASGISVRLSTPLVAAPRFGFMPILVRVANSSGRNGSWHFDFSSGGPEGTAAEIRRSVTIDVTAGQNRDYWIYLPVPDAGIVTAAAAPVAIRSTAAAAPTAPAPAPTPPLPSSSVLSTSELIRLTNLQRDLETLLIQQIGAKAPLATTNVTNQQLAAVTRQIAELRAAMNATPGPPSTTPAATAAEIARLNAVRTEATNRFRQFTAANATPEATAALVREINSLTSQIANLERMQLQANPTATPTTPFASPAASTAAANVQRLRQQISQLEMQALQGGVAPSGANQIMLNDLRDQLVRAEQSLQAAVGAAPAVAPAAATSQRVIVDGVSLVISPTGTVMGLSQSPTVALRNELSTLGYLTVPGTSSSSGSMSNGSVYTSYYSQSGPVASLPEPPPGSLPPHISVSLDTTSFPGQATRTFYMVQSTAALGMMAGPSTSGDLRTTTWTVGPPQGMVQVTVSGPGVPARTEMVLSAALDSGTLAMPPMAASLGLENALRTKLTGLIRTGAPSIAQVDYTALPADWRVWSSFHGVAIRGNQFDNLDPARKAALRQWVALGGKLFIFPGGFGGGGGGGGGGNRFQRGPERIEHLGAGAVYTVGVSSQDSEPLEIAQALRLTSVAPSLPTRNSLEISPNYTLPGAMTRSGRIPNGWLVAGLVAIAIIAAPVNLFIFAPRGRRHRLFLTTPVVALSGAAVFGAVVVINDGIGGHGLRSTVVAILPGENGAAVFQDQVARTGVIASRRFPLEDGVMMTSLPIDPSYVPVMEREVNRASGDWFRPRSFQAQHIRAIVPTRSRVELIGTAPDGAPIVQSSLPANLHEFSFRDDAGKTWLAAELVPGRRVTLTASAGPAPNPDVPQLTANLAALFAEMADSGPGRWKARTAPVDFIPLDTHAAIDWTDSDVLVTGVIVRPVTPAAPATSSAPEATPSVTP